MRASVVFVFALTLVLSGCKKGQCPKAAEARLRQSLDRLVEATRYGAPGVTPARGWHLVKETGAPVRPTERLRAPVLRLSTGLDSVGLEGRFGKQRPKNVADLIQRLRKHRRDTARLYKAQKAQGGDIGNWRDDFLYLAIEGSASARTVAGVLALVYDLGYRRVSLLAHPRNPPKLTTGADAGHLSALQSKLRPLSPDKAASRHNALMEQALKPCPAAFNLWESLGGASPEERLTTLQKKLPAAWVKCGCRVKVGRLLALLHVTSVMAPEDTLVEAVVHLDPKQGRLKVPPSTQWSAVARRAFQRHGKPFWLGPAPAAATASPGVAKWLGKPRKRAPVALGKRKCTIEVPAGLVHKGRFTHSYAFEHATGVPWRHPRILLLSAGNVKNVDDLIKQASLDPGDRVVAKRNLPDGGAWLLRTKLGHLSARRTIRAKNVKPGEVVLSGGVSCSAMWKVGAVAKNDADWKAAGDWLQGLCASIRCP